MGVLPCSVDECDNVMCDAYINDIGYLCPDCLEALREKHGSKPRMSQITEFVETYDPNDPNDRIVDLDDL